MSWNKDQARHISRTGRIERRAEAEYRMKDTFLDCFTVRQSAMRGKHLYSAVEDTRSGDIFAAVLTMETEHATVWWRVETDDFGPCAHDCPAAILDMLTPTDSKIAQEWRRACREGRS